MASTLDEIKAMRPGTLSRDDMAGCYCPDSDDSAGGRFLTSVRDAKLMAHYYQRVDGTPAEMFSALQQWFEAVVRNYANKTLEDL